MSLDMQLPDFKVLELTPVQYEAFFVTVASLVAFLVIWIFFDAWRSRHFRQKALKELAAEHALHHNLPPAEAVLLERIVLDQGDYPSPKGFERHVEILLDQGVPSDMIKDMRIKLGFDKARRGHELASTRECEVGQDVTLSDEHHVWRASVFEVDERALALKVPSDAAEALAAGSHVKVSLWRDFDARYLFETAVAEIRRQPVPLAMLDHPHAMERHQNREYFRAEVDWKVLVTRVVDADVDAEMSRPMADFQTSSAELSPEGAMGVTQMGNQMMCPVMDISEGGLRLRPIPLDNPFKLAAGDRVVIDLPSPEQAGPIIALADVIASDGESVRCVFLNLSMHERDQIHRQILRERRRNKFS